jgi:hypothetical protein
VGRSTPLYDQALGLLEQLRREADLRVEVTRRTDACDELVAAEAIASAMLAVAEALHGVVYVGNASAV